MSADQQRHDDLMQSWVRAPQVSSGDPRKVPDRASWLAQPAHEISAQLTPLKLSVLLPFDGSRRAFHTLRLENPALSRRDYLPALGAQLARIFDALYGLGVHTVIAHLLERDVFLRGTTYVEESMLGAQQVFLGNEFAAVLARHDVLAAACGGWDVVPLIDAQRQAVAGLDRALRAATAAHRTRLMLTSLHPRPFVEEILLRQRALIAQGIETPTFADVRMAAYPLGPERVDIVINNDALRPGNYLSPLLDDNTNLYQLTFSSYQLTELQLRKILYDAAYLRHGRLPEGLLYSDDDVRAFTAHTAAQNACIIGLGRLIGPGLWQPDIHLD